jgi:hypothetical protein
MEWDFVRDAVRNQDARPRIPAAERQGDSQVHVRCLDHRGIARDASTRNGKVFLALVRTVKGADEIPAWTTR